MKCRVSPLRRLIAATIHKLAPSLHLLPGIYGRPRIQAGEAPVVAPYRLRVAELAGRDLSHAADAAVAGELVLLLDALRNEP